MNVHALTYKNFLSFLENNFLSFSAILADSHAYFAPQDPIEKWEPNPRPRNTPQNESSIVIRSWIEVVVTRDNYAAVATFRLAGGAISATAARSSFIKRGSPVANRLSALKSRYASGDDG